MKLQDRVAIVTGGGTGMGRATCLALAAAGAALVVNYSRSQDQAEAVVQQITAAGGQAIAVQADVSQDAQARALVEQAVEQYGRLDILVNNAGYTRRVPHHELEQLTEELIDRTLGVNLKGPLYCTRAAIPHMLKQELGFVINITSVAGRTGVGSSMVYAASKAGLAMMTKSLARAFAPKIRVNAIAPGFVATGFAGWPREALDQARRDTHIDRLVDVEDVAAAVVFLVTGGSALTGEEIMLDGGLASLGAKR